MHESPKLDKYLDETASMSSGLWGEESHTSTCDLRKMKFWLRTKCFPFRNKKRRCKTKAESFSGL